MHLLILHFGGLDKASATPLYLCDDTLQKLGILHFLCFSNNGI